METINSNSIQSDYSHNNHFVISKRIQSAIENSTSNTDHDLINSEYERLSKEYTQYRTIIKPIQVDYSTTLTLDAYIVYYLSRNTLIPIIAFRDLSLNSFFEHIPNSLNILDVGTGTGAVVLGLFDLFSKATLSNVSLNIVAIDKHGPALERQKLLVSNAGFNSKCLTVVPQDLNDVDGAIKLVSKHTAFDFIFIANCLTELERPVGKDLVSNLASLLKEDGAIIIAEAQRDYTKRIIQELATGAQSNGLSVFYPCPQLPNCSDGKCWVWRDHEYDPPSIKIGGKDFQGVPRDRLTLSWLILTKRKLSIYESFNKAKPYLSWRPIAEVRNRIWRNPSSGWRYGTCDGNKSETFAEDNELYPKYKRGSVVGLSDNRELKGYHIL